MDTTWFTRIRVLCDSTRTNKAFPPSISMRPFMMRPTILVQTVHRKYEGFTKKEIKAAKAARQLQGMIGSPSENDYGGNGKQ